MSILIKSIEMPKEPWECPCHNGENGSCNITQKVCFEIPKDCPLVEIPTPHGRFIDTEKFAKDIYRAWTLWEKKGENCYLFSDVLVPMLVGQPTVIESEE